LPYEALLNWKKLGSVRRNLVIWQMAAYYGAAFATEFLKYVGKRKVKDIVNEYFGRGVGPKPGGLISRGFHLAQKDSVNEWWVHPSGMEITRNFTDDTPADIQSVDAPAKDKPEDSASRVLQIDNPPSVDPNGDFEEMFGEVIHTKADAQIFGKGYATEYSDGTIVVNLESGEQFIYMERKGIGEENAYDIYDSNGIKVEGMIIGIDSKEIFNSP
jgi:hypothetical protein